MRHSLFLLILLVQRGLKMQEQGGAVSRIRQIEIIHGQRQTVANGLGDARDAQSFAYRCRWNVAGTVEHWGHIHERTNQYEALFTLKPIDGAWKVTKMELLDEQRLRFETRLRKLSRPVGTAYPSRSNGGTSFHHSRGSNLNAELSVDYPSLKRRRMTGISVAGAF